MAETRDKSQGKPGASDNGRGAFDAVAEAVRQHGEELRAIAGVISVRPGYRFQDGWITDEPAVVVTVLPGKLGEARGQIPPAYGSVPVDLTPASPAEQVLAEAAGERGLVPRGLAPEEELALPGWDRGPEAAARGAEEEPQERAPAHPYKPPPGLHLDEVRAPITITCHSSPDTGWKTLKAFLEKVEHTLTVAMYDFTAPHIRDTVKAVMENVDGELRLILDPGLALDNGGEENNPKKNDITEDEIEDVLQQALGERLEFEWAAVKHQGKVAAGIFPSAYHIKVAVRDGKAIWLSSGNWQSSNQGPFETFPPQSSNGPIMGVYNREWHIVVEHPGLAQLYEKFILWDMKQAHPLQDRAGERGPAASLPELLVPAGPEERGPAKFFPSKEMVFTAQKPLRVQPLLTPDNYAKLVLPLLKDADEKIYFQNQYISITKRTAPLFDQLVDVLLEQIEAGLDVRIILREIGDSRKMLEALRYRGFPASSIRLQKACHNKGIVVDSKVMALGSHNWSSSGTTANRDASLIIHDPGVASFYEEIFLYDWENQARQKVGILQRPPVIHRRGHPGTRGAEEVPTGMMRMPWGAFDED